VEVYPKREAEWPAEIPSFDHTAFKVEDGTYDERVARTKAARSLARETDHGHCTVSHPMASSSNSHSIWTARRSPRQQRLRTHEAA
jgi:hypothetical protein